MAGKLFAAKNWKGPTCKNRDKTNPKKKSKTAKFKFLQARFD
jgi:hypothetical protein